MNLTTSWNGWNDTQGYAWQMESYQKDFATKQKFQVSAFEIYQEFSPSALSVVLTKIARQIIGFSYFEVLFVCSAAFFLTTVVRKICKDYDVFIECERIALIITRRWPYLHIAVGAVSALFINHFPLLCVPLVAGVGVLTALTFRAKWLSAVTDTHRDKEPLKEK